MTAKNDTATGTDFGLYAAGGGAALLLILIGAVVLVVVLRRRSTQNDDYDGYDNDDDDDPSNYEEGDDMGQNMESTDYRPQNVKNPPVLLAHCGDARGSYLYNGHACNACNYLTYR